MVTEADGTAEGPVTMVVDEVGDTIPMEQWKRVVAYHDGLEHIEDAFIEALSAVLEAA